MRKGFIASLGVLLGLGGTSSSEAQKVERVDPNKILFSVPTITNALPPLVPAGKPGGADCVLYEDDWLQVEFLPRARFKEIQLSLKELKAFEAKNRETVGWRNIFVRKHNFAADWAPSFTVLRIGRVLGNPAPRHLYIFSTQSIGRVQDGFCFTVGHNTHVVGYMSNGRVAALGASLGENAEHRKLTEALEKLSSISPIMLVDWRPQMVVLERRGNSYDVWRP